MKTKLFVLMVGLGIIFLNSCNDDLNSLGTGMLPDDDRIRVYIDTFQVEASTFAVDGVYAKTTYATLGELKDPLFGNLKADYLCQFYCPENFEFEYKPIDGKIDSVTFQIVYHTWVGDSLAPMEAQIYPITTPLVKSYYSNFDPTQYATMSEPWGKKTFTARDLSISDEEWNAYNSQTQSYVYIRNVQIEMPTEFGEKLYNESVNNRATFKNQATFNEFFPGLYVTTTQGSGVLLNVLNSRLAIHYKTEKTTKASDGVTDSTYIETVYEGFTPSQEIIQLNRYENSNLSQLTDPNDEYSFIKSPAGVFTQLVIPTKKMAPIAENRMINNFNLTLRGMPQEASDFPLPLPNNLLLIPKDSVKVFFEENRVYDGITSFVATKPIPTTNNPNPTPRIYSFKNITNLISRHLALKPEEDLVVYVIPVTVNTTGSGTSETVTSVTNEFTPTGITLRTDEEEMEMYLYTSQFNGLD